MTLFNLVKLDGSSAKAFIDASVAGRNDAEGVVKEPVVNTDGVQLREGSVGSYIVELIGILGY